MSGSDRGAHRHHAIDYLEFLAPDLTAVKEFYHSAFGWTFTDYGDDYCGFSDGRMHDGKPKFKDVPAGSISQFAYVALRGREPAGEEEAIKFKDELTPDQHADRALSKLKGIVARYGKEQEPYRALVSPMWKTRYGTFDHLARVKEWSVVGEDEAGFPYVGGG